MFRYDHRRRDADTSHQLCQGRLGVSLDLLQMGGIAKTFRINLADILGAGRPCREPSHVGLDLDAAKGLIVARRRGARRADRITAELL